MKRSCRETTTQPSARMNQEPLKIDRIVFPKKSAGLWLGKRNLLPSQWGLSQTEIERIWQSGVAISLANSPACTIPLSDICRAIPKLTHVITLDSKSLEAWLSDGSFTRKEVIATLLHEIGHVVNERPYTHMDSEEFWADDYARHCGNGLQLAEALEKLIKFDPEHFDHDMNHQRLIKLSWNS
jgi:hypothetical protein